MPVSIIPLKPTRRQLLKYVKFGIKHYEGNSCHVPPLVLDEVATLSPKKNPAFDFCRAQSFMAYRDGKPVGRITAIINDAVNKQNGTNDMRFGFVDFIDDQEVVDALFKAVEDWGREQGMTAIIGPMGFSDMDHEGMLIDGFDEMGTMATIYNYPYYPVHMERMGFKKDADWVEFRITVPDAIPEKYARIAEIVKKKYELHTVRFTSRKKIKQQYGHELFRLINEAYAGLYGFSPLTDKQIDQYIEQYIGILRLDGISLVVDKEERLVAVGISMPSLSEGLRRSKGKLFPTGWYHLIRAIRGKTKVVDLLLVAVKPEYQNKGVNALLFTDLLPSFFAARYEAAETNLELEVNESVQRQWEYFDHRLHRRRRAWRKEL